jgi:hypothetical protein
MLKPLPVKAFSGIDGVPQSVQGDQFEKTAFNLERFICSPVPGNMLGRPSLRIRVLVVEKKYQLEQE